LLYLAGGGAFPDALTSSAVQAPRLSLDMQPAGNTYNDSTNSMTVGEVENCLTSDPGNNIQHNHSAHLVIQDVEDLVGWQARMNYDGARMRPSTANFTPFVDNTTGQNVSFVNLPLESGVHRDLVTATNIPPQAVAFQTALVGAVYNATQSAAVSPDTPPKSPPDDTSYSVSGGGVLAALSIQVLAGQAGQHSLYVDLDDGIPNAPGSGVVAFTGSGTATIGLTELALHDGFHGEGVSCLPIAPPALPSPAVPTPPPPPPTSGEPPQINSPDSCPAGMLPHPETNECIPIVDRTADYGIEGPLPPPRAGSQPGGSDDPTPNPGDVAAGFIFKPGELRTTEGSTLRTYMTVYPDGMTNDFGGLGILFTTSTNRTEKPLEVLGLYEGNFPNDPALGIFDWSCLPDYPCVNGATDGSWVVIRNLKTMPCNYAPRNSLGGDWHRLMHYYNETTKVDPGAPPTVPPIWRNRALVLNWCSGFYEIVYEHYYRKNLIDCAATNLCGNWGPIIEVSGSSLPPLPAVSKLGFWNVELFPNPGEPQGLLTTGATWDPPPPEWQTFDLALYWMFGVGSYLDSDADRMPDASDPDDDNDGVLDGSDRFECGGDALNALIRPERIDGAFAGADDDGDALVDEALPGGSEGYDCDGDGFTGRVERSVFSSTNTTKDQACTDSWPPDINNDTFVDIIGDISQVTAHFGESVPPAPARYDMAPDPPNGSIGVIDDIVEISNHFSTTCK